MIQILPLVPDLLLELCQEIGVDDEAPVWGYTASQGTKLLGYCVVAKDEPSRVLALKAEDTAVADGLLRAALYPLYEAGIREYEFAFPLEMTLPASYIIIGRGSLEKLFTPCCKS